VTVMSSVVTGSYRRDCDEQRRTGSYRGDCDERVVTGSRFPFSQHQSKSNSTDEPYLELFGPTISSLCSLFSLLSSCLLSHTHTHTHKTLYDAAHHSNAYAPYHGEETLPGSRIMRDDELIMSLERLTHPDVSLSLSLSLLTPRQ